MTPPQLPRVFTEDEFYWLREKPDSDGIYVDSSDWTIGRAVVRNSNTRRFVLESEGQLWFMLVGFDVEEKAEIFEIGPKIEGQPT